MNKRAWITALVAGFLTTTLYANHPVLLEGNCDSPIPGTTLVDPGSCGDFDGDGRIGTAEDTDSGDRIFGTLEAALGAGIGNAAGTGISLNGTITIVASGRFVPSTTISLPDAGVGPTNVTIEAAPGVNAVIDAVLQGDPMGGNVTRQNIVGMLISASGNDDRIVLRNLVFRNWLEALRVTGGARVTIDNCKFEHNLDYAIRAMGTSQVIVYESSIIDTGSRNGAGVSNFPVPGRGMSFEGSSRGLVAKSQILTSTSDALVNSSALGTGAVSHYQLVVSENGGGIVNATPIVY